MSNETEDAGRLDALERRLPPDEAYALREARQAAREVAPESQSFSEFAGAVFGTAATDSVLAACERCGRTGLDDENETDCELVPDPDDPATLWILVCDGCFTPGDKARREAA